MKAEKKQKWICLLKMAGMYQTEIHLLFRMDEKVMLTIRALFTSCVIRIENSAAMLAVATSTSTAGVTSVPMATGPMSRGWRWLAASLEFPVSERRTRDTKLLWPRRWSGCHRKRWLKLLIQKPYWKGLTH